MRRSGRVSPGTWASTMWRRVSETHELFEEAVALCSSLRIDISVLHSYLDVFNDANRALRHEEFATTLRHFDDSHHKPVLAFLVKSRLIELNPEVTLITDRLFRYRGEISRLATIPEIEEGISDAEADASSSSIDDGLSFSSSK